MFKQIQTSLSVYSFLSLLQVVISFTNLFLLYECFGKSNTTAVYFISTTIIGSILLVLITLTDQFVYHYLKIKLESSINANIFFNTTVFISILVGATFSLFSYFKTSWILTFFANDLPLDDKTLTINLIQVASFIIISFSGTLNLIQAKLNVDGRIFLSYLMSLIPLITQLISWIFLYYNTQSLMVIIWAQSFGIFGSILIFVLLYWKEISPKILFNKAVLIMVKDSIKIRTAHNLHNFFLNYIISNTLSATNPSTTTIFFTIKRIFEAIQQILIGPIQKTFPSLIKKGVESDRSLIVNFFTSHVNLSYYYLLLSSFFIVILLIILPLTSFAAIVEWNYHFLVICTMCYLLITFAIFQETPFTLLIMSQSKSSIIYKSNLLFLLQLYIAVNFVNNNLKDVLLIISILFGQLIILINNKLAARKLILNFN